MRKPAEVEDQMCSSSLPFSRHHLMLYVSLALLLIFTVFFSSLFTSILLTFAVLIISTVANLTFTKQELGFERSEVKLQEKEIIIQEKQPESEIVITKKEAQEVEALKIPEHIVKSPDLLSESESLDLSSTSEDSDAEWPFPNNMDRIPECSDDDSISDDDENLIEIPLSDDYYCVGLKEEPKMLKTQEGQLELLSEINEMNEEDNLIEIDISMGSIMCSSFEIEA